MRFALAVTSDDDAFRPAHRRASDLVRRAQLAREVGFDDVAVTHRYSVGPQTKANDRPVTRLQPIPTLAYLAGALGDEIGYLTSVLLSPGLHPVQLAEDVATLDAMCAGRLTVGLGLGWVPEDFENFQIPRAERGQRFEDLLTVYMDLVRGVSPITSSSHFPITDRTMAARPRPPSGPPLWVGASSSAGVRRAARRADAWIMSAHTPGSELATLAAEHQRERVALGRHPSKEQPLNQVISVAADRSTAWRRAEPELRAWYRQRNHLAGSGPSKTASPEARWIIGDPDSCIQQLDEVVRRLGVTYIIVVMSWQTTSEAARLDSIRLLGDEVLPYVRRSAGGR